MIKFPYELTELSGGLFRLNFIDFPFLKLFGKSHYVLRLEAARALNSLISIRVRKGLDIPKPSDGVDAIPIEEHIDFRLNLHWNMLDQGLNRSELAEELDLSLRAVTNILEGEAEGQSSPYLEAVASREIHCGDCRTVSSICGLHLAPQGAELAMLAV